MRSIKSIAAVREHRGVGTVGSSAGVQKPGVIFANFACLN